MATDKPNSKPVETEGSEPSEVVTKLPKTKSNNPKLQQLVTEVRKRLIVLRADVIGTTSIYEEEKKDEREQERKRDE